MPRAIKSAAYSVDAAAGQANNAARWAAVIMDKIYREGITVTGLGIPLGIKLGQPTADDVGPVVKQIRKIMAAWTEDKP